MTLTEYVNQGTEAKRCSIGSVLVLPEEAEIHYYGTHELVTLRILGGVFQYRTSKRIVKKYDEYASTNHEYYDDNILFTMDDQGNAKKPSCFKLSIMKFDPEELGKGDIFIGNTSSIIGWPKDEFRHLKTLRSGIRPYDINGFKMDPNEYRPIFIHQSEEKEYNRIMMNLKSRR